MYIIKIINLTELAIACEFKCNKVLIHNSNMKYIGLLYFDIYKILMNAKVKFSLSLQRENKDW